MLTPELCQYVAHYSEWHQSMVVHAPLVSRLVREVTVMENGCIVRADIGLLVLAKGDTVQKDHWRLSVDLDIL